MIYPIIIILLLMCELGYFKIADKYNITDRPNERSSHKIVTLRGGGVIFFIGGLFFFLFYGSSYPFFFIGLTIIAVISFIDDIKPVSFWVRLVFHFAAMLLMFYDCGLYALPWYFTLAALILSTGIINAWNFMDGINGITGGYSLVVMASFWYINNYITPFIDNNLIYNISSALLVFIFFNFRQKAKCFSGDVGSVSIAFIIVFILGKLMVETYDFTYLILLLVYGVDTVLTILHRILLRENIFKAHREHLYQILSNELRIPHIVVSSIYMIVQIIFVVGYFSGLFNKTIYLLISVIVLSVIYIILMTKYFKFHVHIASV